MAVLQRTLRDAATRMRPQFRNLAEARAASRKTAFLSHSHHDKLLAKGLAAKLQEDGWQIYIDWEDQTMPNRPNRTTAQKIKEKITQTDFFLFLATHNSMTSRWCPWEIGYADGKKHIDTIFVIPTTDDAGLTHGNEYLDLYRRIDISSQASKFAAFQPQEHGGVLVENIR